VSENNDLIITLGENNEERGLALLDDVLHLPDGTDLDARAEPANQAGRPCRRFRHIEFRQQHGGWARGASRTVDLSAGAMCFRLDAPLRAAPAYVTIEYLDRGVRPFALTRGGEPVHGALLDTGAWQTFTALLGPPSEPQPFDIAVQCDEPMWISRVQVSAKRPAAYGEPDKIVTVRSIAALGPHGDKDGSPQIAVPVGNIGGIQQEHDEATMRSIKPWLPIYKGLGVTSVQSYVRWSLIEPEPDRFDWSFYDRAVELITRHGLKWVVFIMIGPMYATPEWFRRSDKSVYVKCLEHDQECPVQSIWNPHLLEYVDRFFRLAAERYGKSGIVESLMLGPSGDFGETTFNAVYSSPPEGYHTHLGYWCGDEFARRDLPRHLEQKYGNLDALNRAWGTNFGQFADVQPFMPEQAASLQAEVDFNDWYIGSMTRWSERWAEIARLHFPGVPIYHAAGGSGDPIHGGDWSEQAKAAAPHAVGLRVTNEGTPYPFNFVYTRWAATACKHYGVPFGNEPWGGDWSAIGNLGRMYNAITSGANQFWTYAGHLNSRECIEAFVNFRRHLRLEEMLVDVAVYYPKLHFALTDEHGFAEGKPRSIFWPQAEELRDLTDFDLVDSTLIADGALDRYRFLILLQGNTIRRSTLESIEKWVNAGGILITHDFGPISDETGAEWRARLLGGASSGAALQGHPEVAPQGRRRAASLAGQAPEAGDAGMVEHSLPNCIARRVGGGATASFIGCADLRGTNGDHKDHPATDPAFLDMIGAILRSPPSVLAKQGAGSPDPAKTRLRHSTPLGPGEKPRPTSAGRVEADCVMDGVFATRLRGAVLYLNTNDHPVEKRITGPSLDQRVNVPAYSILQVPIPSD